MAGERSQEWMKAKQAEDDSLNENETWDIVQYENIPQNVKIIQAKYVFDIRRHSDGTIKKYKVRLVARGDLQDPTTYSDTYAGTANKKVVLLMLNLANYYDYEVASCDISTAFLHGELEEEVYMKHPDGYYVKLKKAIYGLKQAANRFNAHLKNSLTAAGYETIFSDGSTYKIKKDGKIGYIVTHVDDLLMISNCKELIMDTYEKLLGVYKKMTFDAEATEFIGYAINRDRSNKRMTLSQHGNVDKVLDTFLSIAPRTATTPYLSDYYIDKSKYETPVPLSTSEHTMYQRIVGSLLYLAINSRGDLLAATHALTRRMAAPTTHSMLQARRALAYLYHTRDYVLIFDGNDPSPVIYGWADSSFDVGSMEKRSAYGYCYQFGLQSGMFLNVCRRSTIAAQSTTEAEYYSLAEAARELLWIKNFLYEIDQNQVKVQRIWQDNTTTIKLATSDDVSERSKHIECKFHFVKKLSAKGVIDVQHMPTDEMVADIFTKNLLEPVFNKHAMRIQGMAQQRKKVTFNSHQ